MIALRYRIGEEVKPYIFRKFKSKRKEIEGREDTYNITEIGGLLGDISLSEFSDLLCDFRSDEDDLFPLQDSERWDSEDCESENTSELLPNDDLENNTY